MRSLTIGSLAVMSEGVDTGYIVVSTVEGLDAPEYREDTYDKPGEDGIVLSSLLYGARVVTFPGELIATDAATYETRRRALVAACAIQRDDDGQPTPTVVSLTTQAGNSYFFRGYPRRPVLPNEWGTTGKFNLNFVVPDGLLYENDQLLFGPITPPSGGGVLVPADVPASLAGTTGGAETVTNPGNTTSKPVLTLYGPLTNPYVSNTGTGTYMQLNYTIAGGNYVVIDMANKTIMLNGNSSILSVKESGSDWFGIVPGSNSISLSTSSSSDTGNLQGSFYAAHLGA